MTAEHHLAGPCEGIVLYRDGCTVTVKDRTGREPETVHDFPTDDDARAAEWRIRDELYTKYEARD